MKDAGRYRAFISYAHQDKVWAERLQRRLENFRLPDRTGAKWPMRPIFLDRSELASSPDLSDSINECLQASDALIVICSPAAAASRWVNAEVLRYKQLGRKTIFAFVVEGEPGSTTAGEACFPEALLYEVDEYGELTSIPVEPLAADARKVGDGGDAILKLIAGLLGISFDSLKLRQQRRRIRQACAVAAGTTAMLVLTAYLAIAANVAQQEAERSRDQAEGLISFMLGDLRERLQPVGRLDVLDGVGEQALEYFSSFTDSQVTSNTMLTRATALRQIGEVKVAQGRIEDGLLAFNEASSLLEHSSNGNEALRLFELGQINYWIADAHFKNLELAKAQAYIDKYLAISRSLVELAPDDPDYQLELLYAESNRGTLAFRVNDLETARQYFRNALTIGRNIAVKQPGADADFELADTISWLGAVEANLGNLQSAIDWYQEQLDLRRSLLSARKTPRAKHLLGRNLYHLADVRRQVGQLDTATEGLRESVRVYRELANYDPENHEWRRELAWTRAQLARDGYAASLISAADARTLLARASDAMAAAKGEETAEVRRVTAAIDVEYALIQLLEGFHAEAAEVADKARQGLEPFVTGDDRIRMLPIYAKASYISAEAAQAMDREDHSKQLAEAALIVIDVRKDDQIEVRAYAALLLFLARRPEADSLLDSVAATNYRAPVSQSDSSAGRWWLQRID